MGTLLRAVQAHPTIKRAMKPFHEAPELIKSYNLRRGGVEATLGKDEVLTTNDDDDDDDGYDEGMETTTDSEDISERRLWRNAQLRRNYHDRRANETAEQHAERLSKKRKYNQLVIAKETPEQAQERRLKNRMKRANETPEQTAERLAKDRKRRYLLKVKRTAEEAAEKVLKHSERMRNYYQMRQAKETPEQTAERLRIKRERIRKTRELQRAKKNMHESEDELMTRSPRRKKAKYSEIKLSNETPEKEQKDETTEQTVTHLKTNEERKRAEKCLNMEHRIQAIHEYDRTLDYKAVADKFKRSTSTIKTIVQHRLRYLEVYERIIEKRVCLLNNVVYEWIQRALYQNHVARVSKIHIQKTAIEVLKHINIPEFQIDLDWIEKFYLNWNITDDDLMPRKVSPGHCIEPREELSLKIPDIIEYVRINPFVRSLPKPRTAPQGDNNTPDDNALVDDNETRAVVNGCAKINPLMRTLRKNRVVSHETSGVATACAKINPLVRVLRISRTVLPETFDDKTLVLARKTSGNVTECAKITPRSLRKSLTFSQGDSNTPDDSALKYVNINPLVRVRRLSRTVLLSGKNWVDDRSLVLDRETSGDVTDCGKINPLIRTLRRSQRISSQTETSGDTTLVEINPLMRKSRAVSQADSNSPCDRNIVLDNISSSHEDFEHKTQVDEDTTDHRTFVSDKDISHNITKCAMVEPFSRSLLKPLAVSQADINTPENPTVVPNNATSGEEVELRVATTEVVEKENHPNDNNDPEIKMLKTNHENALNHLQALEDLALLEENVRAIIIISQLEEIIQALK